MKGLLFIMDREQAVLIKSNQFYWTIFCFLAWNDCKNPQTFLTLSPMFFISLNILAIWCPVPFSLFIWKVFFIFLTLSFQTLLTSSFSFIFLHRWKYVHNLGTRWEYHCCRKQRRSSNIHWCQDVQNKGRTTICIRSQWNLMEQR